MKQQYDLNNIGKRLPYTVPINFFSKIDDEIVQRIAERAEPIKSDIRCLHIRYSTLRKVALSAVAVLAFAFATIQTIHLLKSTNGGFSKIENAFCSLSDDDQTFLLDVYNEDLFINIQNEEQ